MKRTYVVPEPFCDAAVVMNNSHDLAQVGLDAALFNNAQNDVEHSSSDKTAYLNIAGAGTQQRRCLPRRAVCCEAGCFGLPALAA